MDILMKILRDLHPDLELTEETDLTRILDSFDIVTLAAELDGRLGVVIPAEELAPENFQSPRTIRELVDRLR